MLDGLPNRCDDDNPLFLGQPGIDFRNLIAQKVYIVCRVVPFRSETGQMINFINTGGHRIMKVRSGFYVGRNTQSITMSHSDDVWKDRGIKTFPPVVCSIVLAFRILFGIEQVGLDEIRFARLDNRPFTFEISSVVDDVIKTSFTILWFESPLWRHNLDRMPA